MAAPSTTLPPSPATASPRRLTAKHKLWILMGLAALFVFITTELFLAADYALYHNYRLQLIRDRALLIPHAVAGTLAFVIGPLQFSTLLRARNLPLHRILGRVYVISVLAAAAFALVLDYGHGDFPGISLQSGLWIICTTAAFLTARNRHIAVHRQWMIRSYAITFTFIINRLLNLWPAYFNLTERQFAIFDIFVCAALFVGCDIAFNYRELTTRRAGASPASSAAS